MSFCKQIFDEINSARKDPNQYAEKVLKYVDYFDGKTLKIPGKTAYISTKEGAEAFKELGDVLKTSQGMEPFEPSKGLFKISNEFLNSSQNCDVDQMDKIDVTKIMEKYGNFKGEFDQAMEFGSENPEEIVINLLVSDGDSSREYRNILLNPKLKKIGIASGKHSSFPNYTVIMACIDFENKVDSDDTENFEESASGATNSQEPLVTLSDMISNNNDKEEEERKRKEAEEEERKRKEAEEEERKRKEAEEEERKRKEAEEEERKRKEEAEEEERKRKEAEEEERKRKEAEEEERRRKEAEEEERKRKEAEEEEKKRKEAEEEERKRKEAEEEERKRKEAEEEERKRKEAEEEERKRKEAEEEERKRKNDEKERKERENQMQNKSESIIMKEDEKPKKSENEREYDILNSLILLYIIFLILNL